MSDRFYQIVSEPGVYFPSVTTVTGIIDKPYLRYWYGKNGTPACEKVMSESSEVGSAVHSYIEGFFNDFKELPKQLDKNKFPTNADKNEKYLQAIHNFHVFEKKYKPKPLAQEYVVYSRSYQYAGTVDGLFKIGKSVVMLDWKTSAKISQEYVLQLNAYNCAQKEMLELGITKLPPPSQLWIVRLDKTREIKLEKDVLKLQPRQEDSQAFLYALGLYRWLFTREKE